MGMTSSRPYLVRALYDWITDNGMTPYLVADAEAAGIAIPEGLAEDGQIVLNISATAVRGFDMGDGAVSFSARFQGRDFAVYVPMPALMAIYARETGQGMSFSGEEPGGGPTPADPEPGPGQRPGLRIVK